MSTRSTNPYAGVEDVPAPRTVGLQQPTDAPRSNRHASLQNPTHEPDRTYAPVTPPAEDAMPTDMAHQGFGERATRAGRDAVRSGVRVK